MTGHNPSTIICFAGPPGVGKTSLAKHLKTKYNFELLDFKELICC